MTVTVCFGRESRNGNLASEFVGRVFGDGLWGNAGKVRVQLGLFTLCMRCLHDISE